MTFDVVESSAYDGRPVNLYWFRIGSSNYRYTTNDKPVVFQGSTYSPVSISDDGQSLSTKIEDVRLKIKVSVHAEISRRVRQSHVAAKTLLTIYQVHLGTAFFRTRWNGYVVSGKQSRAVMTLDCQNILSSFQTNGLRERFSTGCTRVLYGPGCWVDKLDHLVIGNTDAVGNFTVTVNALSSAPDGTYDGGQIEWQSLEDAVQDFGTIESQVGGVLTMVDPPVTLQTGVKLFCYRGCDHSLEVCDSVFGNAPNYGGQPFKPDKNPGNGTTLF